MDSKKFGLILALVVGMIFLWFGSCVVIGIFTASGGFYGIIGAAVIATIIVVLVFTSSLKSINKQQKKNNR